MTLITNILSDETIRFMQLKALLPLLFNYIIRLTEVKIYGTTGVNKLQNNN